MAAGQLRSTTTNDNKNETLYSKASRNELKNVRAKQQKLSRSGADEVESSKGGPPRRSFSALEDPDSVEGVSLDVNKNAPAGGVKLELRMANTKSKSRRTLGDLLSSHHRPSRSNHHRRRQRLTTKGIRDHMGLRKSLSYGQMQDLTSSFHMTDLMDLKQSLHGLQEERQQSQEQSTAEKLATMFENAIRQEKAPGGQQQQNGELLPGLNQLILKLTVNDTMTIVQHLEECQTMYQPVKWGFLRSVLDPDRAIDWEKDVFRELKKSSHSQASSLGEEASYEECSIESSLCSDDSQASWLIRDEGQGYDPTNVIGYDFNDNDGNSGMSLDAYTIHCDSSISLDDFETFEESFAIDTAHERIVLEVGDSWEDSVYEIVEESVATAMEQSIYMEESVYNDESFYFEESVHTTQSMAKPQAVTTANKLLSQSMASQQSGFLYGAQSDDESEEEGEDLFEGIQVPLRQEVNSLEKNEQSPSDQEKGEKEEAISSQQLSKLPAKSTLGDQANLPLQNEAPWEEKTKPENTGTTGSWRQKPAPGEYKNEAVSAQPKLDDTGPESVLKPSPPTSPQLSKPQDSFRNRKTKRVSALIMMWERKSKR